MRLTLGNWASGDGFFDRERELSRFRSYVEEGTHLLIVAPRRVGKTSLLRQAEEQLDHLRFVQVDVQRCRTPEDLVAAVVEACAQRGSLEALVERWAGRVEEIGVDRLHLRLRDAVADDWRGRGDEVLAELADGHRRTVICLDELPLLVERLLEGADGRARADGLLSWLRDVALRHAQSITWVVAGSIGLAPLVARARLSGTINHLHQLVLGPWDEDVVVRFLGELATTYDVPLDAGAARHVAQRLGAGIPYHVQLFFDALRDHPGHEPWTADALDDVYERQLLSSHGHAALRHLEERLAKVLEPKSELPLALDLLTEAAKHGLSETAAVLLQQRHGASAEQLRAVREILEHDGYLMRRGERWVFLSNFVRDWWSLRFSLGFESPEDGAP